jgi:hypothetical protein
MQRYDLGGGVQNEKEKDFNFCSKILHTPFFNRCSAL